MGIKLFFSLLAALLVLPGCLPTNASSVSQPLSATASPTAQVLSLPEPRLKSDMSLEESLFQRRSIRGFSQTPLNLAAVSQILWSAQGITSDAGGRTAPSAGALYPLQVYLAAGNVENFPAGIYRYQPQGHQLILIQSKDIRNDLSQAALGQTVVKDGAIDIVISAIYERTTQKYGDRGVRYAQLETGHAAQNICLQAVALNLGSVPIGAFDDNRVKNLFGMADNESPLYIIPVGNK